MKQIVATALKQANDSLNNIQLVQTPDDNTIPQAPDFGYGETDMDHETDLPEQKPAVINPVLTNTNVNEQTKSDPAVIKTSQGPVRVVKAQNKPQIRSTTKPLQVKPRPKAVMPPANDY